MCLKDIMIYNLLATPESQCYLLFLTESPMSSNTGGGKSEASVAIEVALISRQHTFSFRAFSHESDHKETVRVLICA